MTVCHHITVHKNRCTLFGSNTAETTLMHSLDAVSVSSSYESPSTAYSEIEASLLNS